MFKIKATTFSEFLSELRSRDVEFSCFIVERVCDALDKGLPRTTFPIQSYFAINMNCAEPHYLLALQNNMQSLIDCEEYELCARSQKWIDKLIEEQSQENLA
jgi:hypothetical protein